MFLHLQLEGTNPTTASNCHALLSLTNHFCSNQAINGTYRVTAAITQFAGGTNTYHTELVKRSLREIVPVSQTVFMDECHLPEFQWLSW